MAGSSPSDITSAADSAFALDRCRSLVDFHVWPVDMEDRAANWLSNFKGDELPTALHLLNSFVWISDAIVEQLFLAAFHNLSALTREAGASLLAARSSWQHFFDILMVTQVTGEIPSPADSGHIFARLARDSLKIAESRIVDPQVALRNIINMPARPVVFVDDFVGSGQQFINTWNRSYSVGPGATSSFAEVAKSQRNTKFFYCPAVCTQYGADNIAAQCPQVIVSPGNLMPRQYSCLDPEFWPAGRHKESVAAVEAISQRLGIPATGDQYDWRGFHKLGLCLAFNHKTPDCTIPLFHWFKDGWKPLVRSP